MTVPFLTILSGWLNLGDNGAGHLIVPSGLTIDVNGNLAGMGMITGNVVNSGRIDIGHFGAPRGSITIFGDFTQQASGRLELRLPDQVGGVNDFLQATGTATLNGRLEITPSAGINLALGDEFDFVFYGTLVGQFSSYVLAPLGQGLEWQTIYDVNWLTLKVVQS